MPPYELVKELEDAVHWVEHYEAMGNYNTIWHKTLERVSRAMEKYVTQPEEPDELPEIKEFEYGTQDE